MKVSSVTAENLQVIQSGTCLEATLGLIQHETTYDDRYLQRQHLPFCRVSKSDKRSQ